MRHAIALALAAVLASPVGAAAQGSHPAFSAGLDTPRAEVGAGMTFNQLPDNSGPGSGQTVPDLGFTFSATANLARWLGLGAEVTLVNNMLNSARTGREEVNRVYAIGAGPRMASPFLHAGGRDPIDSRVFAQVLVGAIASDTIPGGRSIQPGVGVDVGTRSGAIVRLELDHTFVRGPRGLAGTRCLVSLVLGAGSAGP